jgi:vitamin B12 transporter
LYYPSTVGEGGEGVYLLVFLMKKSFAVRARVVAPALSLVGLACLGVCAQTNPDKEVAQVVVTASRIPTATTDLLSDVSLITRQHIENSGTTSVPELLGQLAGIQLTSENVRGSNASIFLRGTNSNHTLLLIDGQRISSATTGATALQHLPLDQVDRIEVLRGAASSLYGSDAMGGVIQVFTRKGADTAPVPSLYAGVGQYGSSIFSTAYGGRFNDTTFHVQVGYDDTKGLSEIKASKPGAFDAYNPDRDGYRQTNASFNLSQPLNRDMVLSSSYLYSSGVRHSDNSNCDANWVTCTTNFDNRSKQTLDSGSVSLAWQVLPEWRSNIRLGTSHDRLESLEFDPTTMLVTVPKYKTTQDQFSWQNDWAVGSSKWMAAIDWRGVNVESAKSLDVTSQTTRSAVLGFQNSQGQHLYQASVRRDEVTGLTGQNTGNLGYGYRLNSSWMARANVGTAFHAPTFNDLYWPLDMVNFFQGNPRLKPETSINKEVGIRYATDRTEFGATVYQNRISNLIAYYSDPVTFLGTMNNIGVAEIQGITFNYGRALAGWKWMTTYDILSAKDQATDRTLARRAPRSGSLDVERKDGAWRTGVRAQAISRRFNDSSNNQNLPGYQVDKQWQLEAKMSNALNTDYVAFKNTVTPYNEYSVPGRSIFVGARYSPK